MSLVTSETVVGVFSSTDQARSGVEELRRGGFPQDSISMVIRSDGSKQHSEESEVITDAEIGAAAGGIGGALLALAAVAVPGVGPVLAMGPILAAIGGAGIGAVTGGLIGALTKVGVSQDRATLYAESVRRGDVIVTVRTDHTGADRALQIMHECGAVDIDARAAGWRSENEKERRHDGDEPQTDTQWPHDKAHDIGEDLVDTAAPPRRVS